MFNILVVEDDSEVCGLFCTVLEENGYNALPASDGEKALEIIDKINIDLIITDIMMPVMDGYELVKELRAANYTIPVLMITAKSDFADKREGFKAGADDYCVKPVDVNEMVLRVEALLRRSQMINQRRAHIGNTELDCDTLTVTSDDGQIELPQKEFYLLYKLISSPNRIFTRRQIMDDVWGLENETDTHSLEVHISRLRDHFKNNSDFEIVTVRGLGYKAVKKNA